MKTKRQKSFGTRNKDKCYIYMPSTNYVHVESAPPDIKSVATARPASTTAWPCRSGGHAPSRLVVGHVFLELQQLHDQAPSGRPLLRQHLLVVRDVAHGTDVHVLEGNAAGEGAAEKTPYHYVIHQSSSIRSRGSHFVSAAGNSLHMYNIIDNLGMATV